MRSVFATPPCDDSRFARLTSRQSDWRWPFCVRRRWCPLAVSWANGSFRRIFPSVIVYTLALRAIDINKMANRRFGPGPQRGGRGFPQTANVSPWQGNPAPANNALNNPNLHTQLALALSSLLQPQQQVNDPPSLLSLNTSPGNYQDSYQNRFGDRGRSGFRRSEPYNKNPRTGWRNDRGNRGGASLSSRNRSIAATNKDKNLHSSSKDKPKPDKKSSDNKIPNDSQKSDKDEKQVDLDECRDEENETKRDWKDEKNTSEDKKEEGGAGDKKEDKKDRSKFAGLPNSLLHCFVCNKSMWDGDSFQNHVRGKAHIQMLDSLEESFQITVKILRENMRLAEEKKMIEWNRMQRNNRKFHSRQEPESHCNMCDLKFLGKIIAHRKTDGHQRLKRFLHPNCDTCNLEFPSRMEWVDHRFTPEHMFKVKEMLDAKSGDDEGHIVEETVEWDNEPLLQETIQGEDENPVLELDDDLSNLYNRVPSYIPSRPVGKNSLKPISGFFCEVCGKFLRTEIDAQKHLKTEKHYHEFVSAVKNKFRNNADKIEEVKRKRKKDDEEDAEEVEDTEEKEVVAAVENENGGDDMYDPEEACKEGADGEEDSVESAKAEDKEDNNKWATVDALIKPEDKAEAKVKDEEQPEEEEEAEAAEVKTVSSPATRRRGNVKNGAGPKSKKIRKT